MPSWEIEYNLYIWTNFKTKDVDEKLHKNMFILQKKIADKCIELDTIIPDPKGHACMNSLTYEY